MIIFFYIFRDNILQNVHDLSLIFVQRPTRIDGFFN